MKGNMRFRRLGGSYQLMIETAEDLQNVLELNVAHWAVTSIKINSMICDSAFLETLDSGKNGRIRADEVQAALRWLLSYYKDVSDIVAGADHLTLSKLNPENPAARLIQESVRVAQRNLNLPDSDTITMNELNDHANIISNALQNGDGVIPPDPVESLDPEAAACIRDIMKRVGSHPDVSGVPGVSQEDLDTYESLAKTYLAWIDRKEQDARTLFPFGDHTASFYAAFQTVEEAVDAFFRSCETLNYTAAGEAKLQTVVHTFDPLNAASVDAFLDQSVIAEVNRECVLRLDQRVNPVWRDRLTAFFQAQEQCGLDGKSLSLAEWIALRRNLAPYGAWIASKNTLIFDGAELDCIRAWMNSGVCGRIRELMKADVAVAKNLDGCGEARKLLLYQKDMMEFLNNFVCMHKLFENEAKSMIQVGILVMDGRQFTLCTLVHNIAEHKAIAVRSNICVMYLDIATEGGSAVKSMKVAVAVTSGHMRNLFIGKSGIFYTRDGSVWDAKVIDFIQQPVSIGEALCAPFLKFGEFMQKQADKFFSTKSKSYETNISNVVDKTASAPPGQIVPVPAPAAAPAAAPAGNASNPMMLMGGGIGIAAIGSAFAFIAKSLSGMSFWTVFSILMGILLIFGGPMILSSMLKLFRRNLAVFLEANGYALNRQMRMSIKMGRIFTF